ncbi:MAG: hypothetical protein JXL84_21610 [Deltaproteobacteria bacterium]|nr:hypothetical protein [Deltaproteobacteria bacterium]
MKIMRCQVLCVLAFAAQVFFWHQAEALAAEHVITYGQARHLSVKMEKQGEWIAHEKGSAFGVLLDSGKEAVFLVNQRKVGSGRFKGEKLNLSWKDRPRFTEVRFTPEKIKVTVRDGETPWEIKFRKDKVKVVRDGKEYGSIKFYPENGKLKAKNAGGDEIAVLRNAGGLSGAFAPFLVEGLDEEGRNLLILLFFALDR